MRRWLTLALAASAAGSLLLSVLDDGPAPAPAAEPLDAAAAGAPPPAQPSTQPSAPPPGRWPQLGLEDARGNPFAMAEPKPTALAAGPALPVKAPVAPPPVVIAPLATAATTVAPPPIVWLGRMVAPDGSRLTLLVGDGGDVAAARAGEPLGDAYIVREVGERSVRLEHRASGQPLIVSAAP
ncbi:MAG: hypothetical protein QM750_20560 [Rubrivivax sp.]